MTIPCKLVVVLCLAVFAAGCASPTTSPRQVMPSNIETQAEPLVDLSLGTVSLGYTPANAHEGEMVRVALRRSLIASNIFAPSEPLRLDVELKTLAMKFPAFAATFRVNATGSYVVKTGDGKSAFETLVTSMGISQAAEHFVGAERASMAARRAVAANIKEFSDRLAAYLKNNANDVFTLAGGKTEMRTVAIEPAPASNRGSSSPDTDTFLDQRFMGSRTNVRSGPGTGFDVVKVLDAGSSVKAAAAAEGDWYRVQLDDGRKGFVFSELLLTADAMAERTRLLAAAPPRPEPGPRAEASPIADVKTPSEQTASIVAPSAEPVLEPAPSMILINPGWKPAVGNDLGVPEIGSLNLIGRISGNVSALSIDGSAVSLKPGGFFSLDLTVSDNQVIRFVISQEAGGKDVIYDLTVKAL